MTFARAHQQFRSAAMTTTTTLAPAELSSVPREATASVRILRALVEMVEQAGVPPATFMSAAGLGSDLFAAPDTRMPLSKLYPLCELALDLTGDPALGMHWAETMSEGTFVPISHLIAHSATLRQGFEVLAHFHRLLNDELSYEIVESDDTVTVRSRRFASESLPVQRFCAEMMVVGFYRLIRHISVHARPECVSFEYPAPAYAAEYTRVLGDVVRFDQPFTGLVFDRALLDMPAPHKDDDVREVLQALAERRLLRIMQRTPYALRVRDLLVRQGGPVRADMSTVARSLGLSVRSLRRRLSDERKPYGEVANEALAIIAKHLLREKRRTIQETAYEMGFSDPSTFHRAFKRWTGTTPSAYQEAQQDKTARR